MFVLFFSSPDAPAGAQCISRSGARGCSRVTRYSYLDAKSNRSFGVSLRLTIPAVIRIMVRALHTYRHDVNRVKN